MYTARLINLRDKLQEKHLSGILLNSDANRNYITGFTGDESYALITKERAFFITDSRYIQQAKLEAKLFEVVDYKGDLVSCISNLIRDLKIEKLAFEDEKISFSQYDKFKNGFECELVPQEGMVEELRIVKDDYEIECISKAAEIADKAFSHITNFIKVGMKESEVALELEFFMKKLGASALSFTSIVASGVRSSLPHGTATSKVINDGDFLTLDFGCVYNGYCSDMTRTVVIGKPNEKMIEIYETVKFAQEKALEEIAPGKMCSDIDKVARDYIKSKGYGSYFGHGLGHGVGSEIHEEPRVSPKSKTMLKCGMVITDEPGIYIPEFGGVRIEDLILVTEDGCKVLSKSSKELICI
ncbi:Xaa-Pro peptidase family protein [Clostridium sediminicola]|uniref:M24 family metallopeptidase n=1 Tax=Clostridium sediminicola TaxID=3114879 RepID=UPI0031F20D70